MGCAGYTGCPVLAEFLGLTRRRRLRRRDVSNNTAGKRLQGLVLGLLTCPVAHGVVQILVRSAPHGHLVSAFGPTFDAAWKRKRTTLLEHLAIRCSVAVPRLTAHASLQQLLSARAGVGDDVALQRTTPPRLRSCRHHRWCIRLSVIARCGCFVPYSAMRDGLSDTIGRPLTQARTSSRVEEDIAASAARGMSQISIHVSCAARSAHWIALTLRLPAGSCCCPRR